MFNIEFLQAKSKRQNMVKKSKNKKITEIQEFINYFETQISTQVKILNMLQNNQKQLFIEKSSKLSEIQEKQNMQDELKNELFILNEKKAKKAIQIKEKWGKQKAIKEKNDLLDKEIIEKKNEVEVIMKKMIELNKKIDDVNHNIKIYQNSITTRKENEKLVTNFKQLPFQYQSNIQPQQNEKDEIYDFKKLLTNINDNEEIIQIFDKIESKRENIKFLWDELNKYKKNITKEIEEQNNNSLLAKKMNNVIATLNFIEEIQFAKQTIFENEFILAWEEIKQNNLSTNIVPFSSLTAQVNEAENDQQLTTSHQQPITVPM